MGIIEALRMAVDALRAHKTRSSLTLLGMVIGVFAIIVSVTAVEVIDVYFKEKLQFLGSSTFSVTRTPMIQTGRTDRSVRNRPPITFEQLGNWRVFLKASGILKLPRPSDPILPSHFRASFLYPTTWMR